MKYTYQHMEDLEGVVFPDFKKYNGNLILYGAGINGALCAFALKELGVEFLCFCDGDVSKQGTSYLGYPVFSPQECREKYPEAVLLIDVYGLGEDWKRLKEMNFPEILFPAGLFLGLDCGKAARYVTDVLGRGNDGYSFREEVDAPQVFEWIDEYMIRGITYVKGKREMSRSINLDVTDFCTLRCKNCLALKPYFKTKKDMPWETMERVIDTLLAPKWFRRFHILGGEPFLYPHLDKVLEKLCAAAELDHISIITNATVIPGEDVLQALKNPKIMVRISYYGENSKKYQELEQLCHKRGIEVRVHAQHWLDIGRALDSVSSEEETQFRFTECCQRAGSFFYVQHGKATLCPFASNTRELGLYESNSKDYIDLLENVSPHELMERLGEFYWGDKPLLACKYCNGWANYATKAVPVAQQYKAGEQPEFPNYSK